VKPTDLHAVHERWQMDFKGDVRYGRLGQVKPFNVCDEYTSAPLECILHWGEGHKRSALTSRDVQNDLRQVFERWGRPKQLRMDRDPLWVGSSRLEWPGVLLLWLTALGITPHINRPGRPTDNAQIERGNRTWDEQVRQGTPCKTQSELQARTDQVWEDRREHLPSRNRHCHGQPPLVAHPELAQSARPYNAAREADFFDMQNVYNYLAEWKWERKVDRSGSISMGDYNQRVSRKHSGQVVRVHFAKETGSFVVTAMDDAHTELRRFRHPLISPAYIMGHQGVCVS
jgi:hypothetical protein